MFKSIYTPISNMSESPYSTPSHTRYVCVYKDTYMKYIHYVCVCIIICYKIFQSY